MQTTKVRSFLQRKFSPEGYLSLHIVLGFLLLLICSLAFANLAEDVVTNERIVQFDSAIVNAIHINSDPTLVQLMTLISLAGAQIPVIATIILILYFLWRRNWYELLLFVLVVGGAQIADTLFKLLFHRLRPTFPDPFSSAVGYSFPSGHAMGAMTFYGLIAYLLISNNKTVIGRVLIAAIFALIIGLVGFSRIYLGVHYPSDVLGGYIAGLAWLALTISGVEYFRAWRRQGYPPSAPAANE